MESATNFQGEKLAKAVPMTRHVGQEHAVQRACQPGVPGQRSRRQRRMSRLATGSTCVVFDPLCDLAEGGQPLRQEGPQPARPAGPRQEDVLPIRGVRRGCRRVRPWAMRKVVQQLRWRTPVLEGRTLRAGGRAAQRRTTAGKSAWWRRGRACSAPGSRASARQRPRRPEQPRTPKIRKDAPRRRTERPSRARMARRRG